MAFSIEDKLKFHFYQSINQSINLNFDCHFDYDLKVL